MRIDLKVISSHIITCCKDTTNILNTQIKNAFFSKKQKIGAANRTYLIKSLQDHINYQERVGSHH